MDHRTHRFTRPGKLSKKLEFRIHSNSKRSRSRCKEPDCHPCFLGNLYALAPPAIFNCAPAPTGNDLTPCLHTPQVVSSRWTGASWEDESGKDDKVCGETEEGDPSGGREDEKL